MNGNIFKPLLAGVAVVVGVLQRSPRPERAPPTQTLDRKSHNTAKCRVATGH